MPKILVQQFPVNVSVMNGDTGLAVQTAEVLVIMRNANYLDWQPLYRMGLPVPLILTQAVSPVVAVKSVVDAPPEWKLLIRNLDPAGGPIVQATVEIDSLPIEDIEIVAAVNIPL